MNNKTPCYPEHNLSMPLGSLEILVCPKASLLIKGVAQFYAALYDGVITKEECCNHDSSEKILHLDFPNDIA